MDNWKPWIESIKDNKYSALFGLFILLAIPVTLILVFRSQDTRSSAAAPDKLETEAGVLSSSGVTKQTDTGASGGSYVLFNKSSETNPIAHWKFDGNANDVSGNEYNGALRNGASYTTGIIGQALDLDPGQHVEVNSLIGNPQNITVTAWANLSSVDIWGAEIVSLGDVVGLRLDALDGTTLSAFYWDGTAWRGTLDSTTSYQGTGWHHFAYTIDTITNTQTAYVDGSPIASTSYTGNIVYTGLGSSTFIGKHGNGGDQYDFGGQIDDVRVYDTALSATQIQNIYSSTPVPTESNPTPTSAPAPTIPSNALYVPDSIDSTGNTDVSSQLKAFVNNAPNGSTIVFKKGGTYLISEGMRIGGRSGLTLEGNGATLKITGYIHWSGSAILVEGQSSNTTIRNFKILGNNPTSGTTGACCSREGQHGVLITGSTNTNVENMNISYVGGDCIYIAPYNDTIMNDGIVVRNLTCSYTGRHGADMKGNKDILMEKSSFDKIGLHVFNLEMNKANHYSTNVTIRDNTIGTYGLTSNYAGWLLAAGGNADALVSNITLTNNTVKGGPRGWDGKNVGLRVGAWGNRKNFTITNNICNTPVDGPSMYFENVNGVTVTGNTQPLSSGSLVSSPGSTNVTVGNNNTN